jgi:BlaI family transcriptional regulator, penicillinase repressor
MRRPVRDVTETELAILQALWDLGPSTVRQLVERLYPGAGPSAPATVQKLLERLESKDYVARDRSGPAQRFRATIDRGALVAARLRGVAEQLCDGSLTSLLTHLVQTESLGEDDRRALRALVVGWEAPGKKPGREEPRGKRGR